MIAQRLPAYDPRDPDVVARARALLVSEGYRVLAPLAAGGFVTDAFDLSWKQPYQCAALVDVETLGDADPETDEIVQLAVQRVLFDREHGHILRCMSGYVDWEEPSRGIPADLAHGITNADLIERHFCDEVVLEQFRYLDPKGHACDVDLVVAHNAAFDAPRLVRRFPTLRPLPWGCSLRDVPWAQHGYESTKLKYLLQDHTDTHAWSHDAGLDVTALGLILATPFADDHTSPFATLLRNAFAPRVLVRALGNTFAAKDAFKARGYIWNAGERAWWKELLGDGAAERQWLAEAVYHASPNPAEIETLTPSTRFLASARGGRRRPTPQLSR